MNDELIDSTSCPALANEPILPHEHAIDLFLNVTVDIIHGAWEKAHLDSNLI